MTTQRDRLWTKGCPNEKSHFLLCSILSILLSCAALTANGQRVALRNNLLYDATLTPNLGLEILASPAWSVGVNAGFNAWDLDKEQNKKWRHLMISPNVRYYLQRRDSLSRNPFPSAAPARTSRFLGIHAVYSHYNAGGIDFPFGLYGEASDHRVQGDLAALGGSFGYNWRLSGHWHLEAELGAAVGYAWYKKYDCDHCGYYHGKEHKAFLMPKAAVNVVYYFGSQPSPAPAAAPEEVPVAPTLVFHAVKKNTGQAGLLQTDNPVLEHISNYRPYDRTRILRKEKGALYVHFPLDNSEIDHSFKSNEQTLDRIVSITRQIMADSTSLVKRIQIVGLASVEGPIARNEQLAAERAEVLKRYIQQHVATPDSLFELNNGGEAWAELRDQLNDENHDGVFDAVLSIIDSEPDANLREQRLRRLNGGQAWQYMRDQLLGDQRNSGYLRIYFDYAPDEAAATINEASRQLADGRYEAALRLLETVATDRRAQNALGVALWHCGRQSEAAACFRKAAADGNADAAENLRQLNLE